MTDTGITFGRAFVLRRDRDISDVSGTGIIADGVEFPDGHAVIHWRGRWPLTTPHPDGLDSIMAIHDHGGQGDLHIIWADDHAAQRRKVLADIVEAFDVPAAAMGDEAARAGLHRQITRILTTEHQRRAALQTVASPEEHCRGLADVLMPVIDELLAQRSRAQKTAGRAYLLADRWEAAHGSSMCLVRAAGVELRGELDSAHTGLERQGVTANTAAEAENEPAAAECSAQRFGFGDGPRLCIRAAQHRGDHIDEHGFHWSDTVAVYPLIDDEPRPGGLRGLLEHVGIDTRGRDISVAGRVVDAAEPVHGSAYASSCSSPDHACPSCGDCVYQHPGPGGCFDPRQAPPDQGPLTGVQVRDPDGAPPIPRPFHHRLVDAVLHRGPGYDLTTDDGEAGCPLCPGAPPFPRHQYAAHVREKHFPYVPGASDLHQQPDTPREHP
ncbi:MAG TPA: hypothetical protein VFH77_17390 [Streptomyces sp.]|nr:hypothetical protein [Streptomyces sp.]